jgi:ankyrin repeat protein
VQVQLADESDATRAAYDCINARDVEGLRHAIAAMVSGEIDGAVRRKTLLQTAAMDGQLEAVSLLLSSGANPDSVDSGGNSPLHAAIGAECCEDGAAIAAALIEAGCDRNRRNGRGMTALHVAAEQGHTLASELLVALGCQVDLRTRGTSETPLFLAIKSKTQKIVRLLVEQGGCNISAADGDGDTPLHLSLVMAADDPECLDIARYLIQNGANAVHRNQRGLAALDVCPESAFAGIKQSFITAQVQTLLDHQRSSDPGSIKVGWRVRVREDVAAPFHGWQGGTRGDVLVVRHIREDEVAVTFIDPDIPLRFLISEVERVFDTFGVTLTASTSGDAVYNVFKPDRDWYWQSDGERGQHWIQLELPQTAEVSALELQVHEGGVAFIPKRIEVLVGESAADLQPYASTEVVSYGWTAMIPNHSQLRGRVIRLSVRSCHESGINCRISGIRLLCTVQETELTVPSSLNSFVPVQWEDVSVGTESGTLLKGRYQLGRKLAKGGYGVTCVGSSPNSAAAVLRSCVSVTVGSTRV